MSSQLLHSPMSGSVGGVTRNTVTAGHIFIHSREHTANIYKCQPSVYLDSHIQIIFMYSTLLIWLYKLINITHSIANK